MAKKTATRSRRKSAARSKSRKKTAKKRTSRNLITKLRIIIGEIFSTPDIFTKERKTNLIGLFLLVIGVLTILSLLTTNQGLIGSAWVGLLQQIFGWGMFIVPLALIVGGAGILLRKLSDRLPGFEAEKIVGATSFFLLALVLMHALLGATTFARGMEIAKNGQGGGIIGAAIYALLVRSLGVGGAIVVILAWLLVSTTFLIGTSLPELVDYALKGWDWIRQQFTLFDVVGMAPLQNHGFVIGAGGIGNLIPRAQFPFGCHRAEVRPAPQHHRHLKTTFDPQIAPESLEDAPTLQ